MRITGKNCILHGAEGVTPPLPFITVSGEEGRRLVEAGLAIAIDGMPEAVPVETIVDEIPPAVPPMETADDSAADSDGATAAESIDMDTLAEIIEALDLIEEGDLVKTGARAGRPKVSAVANVLGRDVTIDEIDAAWTAKESGA